MKRQFVTVTLVIFIVLTALIYGLKTYIPAYHTLVLETGNVIMAILTLSSYLIMSRQTGASPSAFVRGVSATSFLRLMVCMISVAIYVGLNRDDIHKGTVFALLIIYAVYMAAETLLLSKMARAGK